MHWQNSSPGHCTNTRRNIKYPKAGKVDDSVGKWAFCIDRNRIFKKEIN